VHVTRESRQGRLQTARVNERPEKRPGVPSILRRPSPRNALSDIRLGPTRRHGFATTAPLVDAFAPPWSNAVSCENQGAWVPVHATRCHGRASLNLGVVRRLLQPIRRADTPDEPSTLAREWGFRPAARRHQGAGCVGLIGALPHRGPASRDLLRSGFHRRVPLARTEQVTGRSTRGRRARALDEVARALLVGPRAPGSPVRLTTRPGRPGSSAHRPRLFLDATSRKVAPSRESRCLPSR